MRRKQPLHHVHCKHKRGESKCAFAISTAQFQIAQRQQPTRQHNHDEDTQKKRDEGAIFETRNRNSGLSRLIPGVKDLELDRFSVESSGFDVELDVRLVGI